MLMTSEWAFILDEADELSAMILSSEPVKRLKEAYAVVYTDVELASQIQAFGRMKEHYEDVQRFGKYHPDYHTIMKKIREQKRALDLDDRIAALKLAENDVQDLLDEISLIIGRSVSEAVKVPVSNPFFNSGSSCGTGCGTGGSGLGSANYGNRSRWRIRKRNRFRPGPVHPFGNYPSDTDYLNKFASRMIPLGCGS